MHKNRCVHAGTGVKGQAHARKGFRAADGAKHGPPREQGGAAGARGAGPLLRL